MIIVNGQEICFESGMTVADALKAAGESTSAMTLVMVNGIVLPWSQFHSEPLADGARIQLLTLVSGG